ncbi:MAG: hypothetical protein GXO79_14115 [Chlorobi bacterium]|nr:hypothetical protein [Chlorobiota bacterium]
MKSKQIKLLKRQIAKLEEKDFELSAWKISTTLVLEKIFGKNSNEINQVNAISENMSSWTLRDNLGDQSSTKSKTLARQILETCIDELEMNDEPIDLENKILEQFKKEFTGTQYEQLLKLIKQNDIKGLDKTSKELNKLEKKALVNILTNILKEIATSK